MFRVYSDRMLVISISMSMLATRVSTVGVCWFAPFFCATTFYYILLGIYGLGVSFSFWLDSSNSFRCIFSAISPSSLFFESSFCQKSNWCWHLVFCGSFDDLLYQPKFVQPVSVPIDLSQFVPLRSISCEFAQTHLAFQFAFYLQNITIIISGNLVWRTCWRISQFAMLLLD